MGEALRASEEKYRSFFEEDLAGNYVSTPDGRLLACNPSFAGIMGFDSVAAAMRSALWSTTRAARHGSPSWRCSGSTDGSGTTSMSFAAWMDPCGGSSRTPGRFKQDGELVEIHGYVIDYTEHRKTEHCMAAHSQIADQMSKVPLQVTEAIREGRAIPDAKLAALCGFTDTLVAKRGLPALEGRGGDLPERGLSGAPGAGDHPGLAVKTLSNYSNHLFHTPIDAMFAKREWTKSA